MKNNRLVFLFVFILFLSFVSCGKITQVADKPEDAKSFSLDYAVEVWSTENIAEMKKVDKNFSTSNIFSVLEDQVFAQVLGVEDRGNRKALSWGKAILYEAVLPIEAKRKTDKKVSDNANVLAVVKVNLKSKSYRKDGLELIKEDHYWTKIDFDQSKFRWKCKSTKIAYNFPFYLIRFWVDSDKYYFKIIEEDFVSKNKVVNLSDVTVYDTFVAILYLLDYEHNSGSIIDTVSFADISNIYNQKFFSEIKYRLPENKVKKFKDKEPVFLFDREYEKELLKTLRLIKGKDLKEAKLFVNNQLSKFLSKKAKEILIKNIDDNFKNP
jgi:hypothetical protein